VGGGTRRQSISTFSMLKCSKGHAETLAHFGRQGFVCKSLREHFKREMFQLNKIL
jgi:hypothetical protein